MDFLLAYNHVKKHNVARRDMFHKKEKYDMEVVSSAAAEDAEADIGCDGGVDDDNIVAIRCTTYRFHRNGQNWYECG